MALAPTAVMDASCLAFEIMLSPVALFSRSLSRGFLRRTGRLAHRTPAARDDGRAEATGFLPGRSQRQIR